MDLILDTNEWQLTSRFGDDGEIDTPILLHLRAVFRYTQVRILSQRTPPLDAAS